MSDAHAGLPLDLPPMEARQVAEIPRDDGWLYEPKWDGFRCVAFAEASGVRLQSKSGRGLERYFPEVAAALGTLAPPFVVDGELLIERDGGTSFDDLLQRIHPAASRVARLARETPACYLVFDLLADRDGPTLVRPLAERRARLEAFFDAVDRADVRLSPATRDVAVVDDWYARAGGALDGVIAKRLDAPYAAGARDAVVKIKPVRSADCVVAGYRMTGDALGSVLLGLYDDAGLLHYVGHTSGYDAAAKRELLARLRSLDAPASFTGREPGGESRWNRGASTRWHAVRPELVLEVGFDQVTAGRFRHGTRPLRLRPDKAPAACSTAQLENVDRTILLAARNNRATLR